MTHVLARSISSDINLPAPPCHFDEMFTRPHIADAALTNCVATPFPASTR